MLVCNRLNISKSRVYILLLFLIAIPFYGHGQSTILNSDTESDSISLDSVAPEVKPETAKVAPAKAKKSEAIDAVIDYAAQDSIVFLGNGTGFLHGKGDVTYKNINLKADFIRVKMDSSLIYAHGTTDSIGKPIGDPIFKEGSTDYKSKTLTYNLKTKKGFIRQAVTKQGDGYIISDKTKKNTEDFLCVADGKYTTCDNTDHPDFYLSLSRAKVKPGKYIVTGPAHLVVADVPLPIIIPFGFFPFTDKYSSGVLMPTYTDDVTRGFGFINGGYYFAINDFMDLELKSEIYTKGTFALNTSTKYIKKYKYRGNFNVTYREDVTGEINTKDYSKFNNFSVNWSHSQDPKADPFSTFTALVNFSTNGYYQKNINSYYNPAQNSQNTKTSTITHTLRFPESPFNMTSAFELNQHTIDTSINVKLPSININMGRVYPFKKKEAVGSERWYEKISISYTGTLANSINTKEYKILTSSLSNDWKNGMNHNIPISATYTVLKYINLTASANFNDKMYLKSTDKGWDAINKREIITNTNNKFSNVWDYNLSIGLSTKLYGFFIPSRKIFGDKVDRIRHMMTPTISLSYHPDFSDAGYGYYDYYDRFSPAGVYLDRVKYSHYANELYSGPGAGKSGSIGFSLSNNVEMKVKNDKDTTGLNPFKKISLIDNFTISSGYNMVADSLKWQKINASVHLKFGPTYSLTLAGVFNPYFYGLDKVGNPVMIDKLRWNYGQFPVFEGTSTSFSYTFSNDTFNPKKKKTDNKTTTDPNNPNGTNTPVDPNAPPIKKPEDKSTAENDADGYRKVKIPWSISVNYTVRYGMSNFNKTKMEYDMELTHGLSLSGNISLTPNWRFSTSTSYDFKIKQFSYASINIIRKLHCWTMTAMAVPFGPYKSYTFRLAVDATMLQDLKYDKKGLPGANNTTWY
jgi:LptD protein